jgi:hypothetical protein
LQTTLFWGRGEGLGSLRLDLGVVPPGVVVVVVVLQLDLLPAAAAPLLRPLFSLAIMEAFFALIVDADVEESVCCGCGRLRDLRLPPPPPLLEPLSKESEEEVCGSDGSVVLVPPSEGLGASGFGAMGRYLDIICPVLDANVGVPAYIAIQQQPP